MPLALTMSKADPLKQSLRGEKSSVCLGVQDCRLAWPHVLLHRALSEGQKQEKDGQKRWATSSVQGIREEAGYHLRLQLPLRDR